MACKNLFFVGVFALGFLATDLAQAQDYVPGEVIVKLRESSGSEQAFAFLGKAMTDRQMQLEGAFGRIDLYHFKLGKGQSVQQAIAELSQDPAVEYAEPNYILRKSSQTGIENSFSLEEIGQRLSSGEDLFATSAPVDFYESWSAPSAQSSSRPIVAVIDTGLDLSHSVFAHNNVVWRNPGEIPDNGIDDDGNGYIDDVYGWNFVNNSGHMFDDDGHGTHVSGIVLSVAHDIFSGESFDSKIQIMPLKFLDGNGMGTTGNAIKAIYYAVNQGAQVLNNSWGGPNYSAALHEAISFSYSKGVSFVAAAGNAGSSNDQAPMYPASYNVPHVMSVAATTNSDFLASFSNYGFNSVHLGSPGTSILSTVPGDKFGNSSGTSMAAPFVAGVAALMKRESPLMEGFQIKSIINEESDPISFLSGKVFSESRLNFANPIVRAKSEALVDSPVYSSGVPTRQLASTTGGCGTVSTMYMDRHHQSGRGGGMGAGRGSGLGYVILVLALMALPLVVAVALRARAKADSPESRRRHERFKFDSEVKVNVGGRELVGSVSSISLGGVQINTEAMLEQGGIVSMSISSPDGKEQIQVEGRVVWSEAKKAYGVAFEQAPDSALSQIRSWTKA